MDNLQITRRGFLGLSAAALRAQSAGAPFDRYDVHMHIHRVPPAFLAGMERARWRGLSICDSREIGDEPSKLPEMIRGTAQLHRESNGRFAWATTFDPRPWETPGFTESTIAALQQNFKDGAIAVKIWKNIGMKIQARSGRYLMPDNPALMPLYEAIQKADRTLAAHLAEPDGAWLPLNERNPEIGYYGNNPQWHMYGKPGVPSKEEILSARDRVAAIYPKLRLVGCHFGSNEDNLGALAKRLDTYPNFAVDMAARVRYLAAGDRETMRQFVMRYQDRLLFGTDSNMGDRSDEAAWTAINAQQEREYRFFASGEVMEYRTRQVQGLAIPENVVRKIFHDNPRRWYPGLASLS
jgi:predicted TIM-barrel fold metal-dependent hydrolase